MRFFKHYYNDRLARARPDMDCGGFAWNRMAYYDRESMLDEGLCPVAPNFFMDISEACLPKVDEAVEIVNRWGVEASYFAEKLQTVEGFEVVRLDGTGWAMDGYPFSRAYGGYPLFKGPCLEGFRNEFKGNTPPSFLYFEEKGYVCQDMFCLDARKLEFEERRAV
jgi:hypothetical protein